MNKTQILLIVIITTIALYWLIVPGHGENYSNGQRTGDIYKFSRKGLFIKSWEGTMYLGGYHTTGGKSPVMETDKFYFSLYGDSTADVIEKLNECSQKRLQCTVKYKEWFIQPWGIDSNYVVTNVIVN